MGFNGIVNSGGDGSTGAEDYSMTLLAQRSRQFDTSYIKLTTYEMERIAHKPSQMILYCQMAQDKENGRICQNFLQEGGTKVFSPIRGVCYSINLQSFLPSNLSSYPFNPYLPEVMQVSLDLRPVCLQLKLLIQIWQKGEWFH